MPKPRSALCRLFLTQFVTCRTALLTAANAHSGRHSTTATTRLLAEYIRRHRGDAVETERCSDCRISFQSAQSPRGAMLAVRKGSIVVIVLLYSSSSSSSRSLFGSNCSSFDCGTLVRCSGSRYPRLDLLQRRKEEIELSRGTFPDNSQFQSL